MNSNYENEEAECVGFSKNLGQKLMFLVIGGGIGAAITLLFAPKSGREVRDDIADLAGKGYDKALTTANEVKHRTSEFYETAIEKGSDLLDVVSAGTSAIKKEVASDVEKIGSIVESPRKAELGNAKPAIF